MRARRCRDDTPSPSRSSPRQAGDAPPPKARAAPLNGGPRQRQFLPEDYQNDPPAVQPSSGQTNPSHTQNDRAALAPSPANKATDQTSKSRDPQMVPDSAAVPEAPASPAARSAMPAAPGRSAAGSGREPAAIPPQAS